VRAIVGPRLDGVGVRSRAHQIALPHQHPDVRARRVVALDQRRVRVLGLGGDEHRAALQIVILLGVQAPEVTALVQRHDHLAAHLAQRRPALAQHHLADRRGATAQHVRREQRVAERALGLQIHLGKKALHRPRHQLDPQLHDHDDRVVQRMCGRPAGDAIEAVRQERAVAQRIEGREVPCDQRAARIVAVQIELEVPHALRVELLVERLVRVTPLVEHELGRLHVIAVVGALRLEVIEAQLVVERRCRPATGEKERKNEHPSHAATVPPGAREACCAGACCTASGHGSTIMIAGSWRSQWRCCWRRSGS